MLVENTLILSAMLLKSIGYEVFFAIMPSGNIGKIVNFTSF
ncbi:hypothetical protein VCR14J2_390337 [Vibrio coralliirubri]|nr:hypothetical protein VCR14J2_390337 [Vibrio coralliirubri]